MEEATFIALHSSSRKREQQQEDYVEGERGFQLKLELFLFGLKTNIKLLSIDNVRLLS